jgi:hypothetical protein
LVSLASCGWHLNGQTSIDLTGQAKLASGTTLPAQCAIGQIFFKSNAPAGANLYTCIAQNSWMAVGLSQGAAASRPVNCTFGQIWLSTDTGAMTYCSITGSPGTWSPTLGGQSASGVPPGGSAGQVLSKNSNTDNDTHWVTNTGSGSSAVLTPVSYSATPAFTVSASSTPQVFAMTLAGNVTSSTLTTASAMAGQSISFVLTQDGAGSRTFAWPPNVQGACVISGTASVATTVTGIFDGSKLNTTGCSSTDPPTILAVGLTRSALPAPPSSNVGCWLDSTANTEACIDSSGSVTRMVRVWSGITVLGTSAISSAACATDVTVSATGVLTSDVVTAGFSAKPTAVTGYMPLTTGMLTIIPWLSSNNVNFTVCNGTGSPITPGAITLNWRVVR